MEITVIWSGALTFAFGLLSWIIRGYIEELKRVTTEAGIPWG